MVRRHDALRAPQNKISVHSSGKVDVNTASPQVLSTLLRAESGWFQAMENQGNSCGQDSETLKAGEAALNLYVRMIVDARQLRQAPSPMSKPFRGTAGVTAFLNVLRNPLASIMASSASITSSLFGPITEEMVLQRYQLTLDNIELQKEFRDTATSKRVLQQRVTCSDFRRRELRPITRRLFAVLKRDEKTVRTLYQGGMMASKLSVLTSVVIQSNYVNRLLHFGRRIVDLEQLDIDVYQRLSRQPRSCSTTSCKVVSPKKQSIVQRLHIWLPL